MRIIFHVLNRRIVVQDEAPFEENKHPRATNGQFGSGGGGAGSGFQTHKTVTSALSAKTKGSSSERVSLRALLKDPHISKEHASAVKEKILESFADHHAAYLKKGDTVNAAIIAGKTADHAKKYGKSDPLAVKTVTQANSGYTPQVQAQAQSVMKAELPKPESGQFTPQETAEFNDLVSFGGENSAKKWTTRAKEKVKSLGLDMSVGECAHIVAYSGDGYKKTNSELRAGVLDESTVKHTNALNNALDKLPVHAGTVYRKVGASVPHHLYQPGKVFVESGFMSTSKDTGVWAGEVRFTIKSKTGRDIQKISSNSHEEEVLFKSGTRFKIVSRIGNHIHMEEIDGR